MFSVSPVTTHVTAGVRGNPASITNSSSGSWKRNDGARRERHGNPSRTVYSMRKKDHPLDGPGPQWSLKMIVTVLCAGVGAILALYVFRVL